MTFLVITVYSVALSAAWFVAGIPGATAVGLGSVLVEHARTPSGRRRVSRARR